ncbi:MAG: glycosyl hydrolase family 18 protein, partial [candidate division KSB1 bacterium]|nr:glycosyl hydrolase family 18 protein [candidate division KSB1 bacterium]
AWPLADGTIAGYDNLIYPELIEQAHQAGKKVLIALGGWGHCAGFSPMAANPTVRAKFVTNLVTYLSDHGYDGVDFDWEYPQNAADSANQTSLIKEVRQAFDQANPSWRITMAVTASDWYGRWNNYSALLPYVDWYNVMTYDFHGSWTDHAGHNAPLYAPPTDYDGSVHQGITYLNSTRRVPKTKIVMGLPFYGREFNAAALYGPSTGATELMYFEIVERINLGWVYHWDDFSKVPYLTNADHTKLITFDDSVSIRLKCEYARERGLSGVMIWALGQDVVAGTQPLLEAVGRAMSTPVGIAITEHPVARDFELFDNYPNPFHATTTIEYYLERDLPVKLSVYDVTGRLVEVLQNSLARKGKNTITWKASGHASGLYFYKLEICHLVVARKMLFLKD